MSHTADASARSTVLPPDRTLHPSPPPSAAEGGRSKSPEPRLAPPGAGLPWPELLAARVIFRVRRWRGSAAAFDSDFVAQRGRIADLVRRCDPALAGRRVLIARPRGLEDSSRNWSVWMTLDHLRIVNERIAAIVRQLAAGRVPAGAASTALVKPSATVTSDVRDAYERACDDLLRAFAAAGPSGSRARYAHPWFGPLDIRGWHAMAGMHMGLHRVQIERILAGLASANADAAA